MKVDENILSLCLVSRKVYGLVVYFSAWSSLNFYLYFVMICNHDNRFLFVMQTLSYAFQLPRVSINKHSSNIEWQT